MSQETNIPDSLLGFYVPRGTKIPSRLSGMFVLERNFPVDQLKNFEIFQLIHRKIPFPGERKFTADPPKNFVPRGTKFFN